MPGTVERVNRFVWPATSGETTPDLKRSFVWEAETLRRAVLDAVWRIAAGGVTRECLADRAISESKLETAVQSQVGLDDLTVTVLKFAAACLSADAAGRAKVQDGYLTAAKFADATITAGKLASAVGAYTIPAGTMLLFSGETAPAGWFECNGQEQRISDYPALAAACGTLWGTPAGGALYFKLPDFRGYFSRGWNHTASNDPDVATRVGGNHVGSTQQDAVKAHTHPYAVRGVLGGTIMGRYVYVSSTQSTNSSGGGESRPINKALMKIIKW